MIRNFIPPFLMKVLSYTLILSFSAPLPALGKSTEKSTVALIMTEKTDIKSTATQLLQKIKAQLATTAQILPIQTSEQLSLTSKTDDPKLNEALDLMSRTMDQYSNYKNSEKDTLTALNSLIYFMMAEVTPSKQSSELMQSAILTKAWLEFKSGDKVASTKTLVQFMQVPTSSPVDLSYYPPNFRKYAQTSFKSPKDSVNQQNVNLISNPAGADVFINHKHVGVAPVTLSLPINETFIVGFASTGRKSSVKKVLVNSKTNQIRSSLSWNSKANNQPKPWHKLNAKEKILWASQLSASSQADQSVLFGTIRKNDGVVPQATVYDARYSQLMKVISYPKTIPENELDSAETAKFFSDKLKPYLTADSVNYWQSNIDKSQILDHRIASRGKKPLHKKTPLLIAGAAVLLAGTITAVVLATSGGGASPQNTGGVTINFNGL